MDVALILLLIGGIILTVGDILMKKWVNTNLYLFYFIGMIVYLVGLNFLAQSFKFKNIAVASVIFVIINDKSRSWASSFRPPKPPSSARLVNHNVRSLGRLFNF